ncbi:hypothetical protein Hanom_Chr13g01187741 [Helianthus anomalus]
MILVHNTINFVLQISFSSSSSSSSFFQPSYVYTSSSKGFFYSSICAFLALSGKSVLVRLAPRRAFYNPGCMYVPPFLVRKIFTQIFSFINVQLFNMYTLSS